MNEDLTLIQRLKKARVIQVLAVYLGASWVVLQIADVLQDAVGLPQWVSALAVLLLLIGLIIILATAWVQSLATTTAMEEAGEVPTDWEIAPGDVVQSLKSGKLPHLTWGRAILGGVVALSLLFGGTGLYVGFRGGPGSLGPQEAGADVAAAGIAIVPFSVTGGEDLGLWREGMVDLLATNLDGMGGFRTIDSRTVMAQWRERVTGQDSPDLRTALEVAAESGARYGLVGTLVGNPAGIRISAELYDLSSGEKLVTASQEGTADQVLELTSALSVELTRELMRETGQGSVADVRLGALTTTSLPALRSYLEGESAFRNADFATAISHYEEAVEQDSLFALAWMRLASAFGWLDNIGSEAGARAGERSAALVDRLPARDRIVVLATEAVRTGDADFFGEIQEAVRIYPDDPDLWNELGEYIYHVGLEVGMATPEQAMEAFEKAIELDPTFGPYHVHPLEFVIARGDRADAEARLERYKELTVDERNIQEFSLAIPLLMGDSAEAEEALAVSRTMAMGSLGKVRVAMTNRTDNYRRLRAMLWANRNRAGSDHQWILYSLAVEGALARHDRLLDSLEVPAATKGVAMGWALGNWPDADFTRSGAVDPAICEEPVVNSTCQLFVGWGHARAGNLAVARESMGILRTRGEAGSEFAARSADAIEGTIAAEEGRLDDARRLLAPVARGVDNPAGLSRTTLGEVEWAEGNVTEAIRHHSGNLFNYNRALSARALARIHDERDETEQARRFYRSFVEITRAGDPNLPAIVEARQALERLGG